MKSMCSVCTEYFWNLQWICKPQSGKDQKGSVELLLWDPPYNVRRLQEAQNSNYDVLNAQDREAFSNFAEYVLKKRGHEHIFCSAVKFASLGWRFCTCMEKIEKSAGRTEVSVMEQTPFFYSWEDDNFLCVLLVKRLWRTNVVGQAILICRKGLFFNFKLTRIYLDTPEDIIWRILDGQIRFLTSHVDRRINEPGGLVRCIQFQGFALSMARKKHV